MRWAWRVIGETGFLGGCGAESVIGHVDDISSTRLRFDSSHTSIRIEGILSHARLAGGQLVQHLGSSS